MPQMAAKSEANKARSLVELIGETTKTALTPATAFYPLTGIVFNTLDGDDVKCAPVVLQLDSGQLHPSSTDGRLERERAGLR